MAGMGRFWAYAFRIDPEAPVVDIQLFVEDLALEYWLELLAPEDATGDGRLSGRIPVRITTEPRLGVKVGAGFLQAESGGHLRIRDADLIREVLTQNSEEFSDETDYSQMVLDRITGALQDFEYSKLRFDILQQGGGLTLRVTAAGKGRKVNQELFLTVNLNGFDKLIDPALAMELGIE
jgi:hypothetical protein